MDTVLQCNLRSAEYRKHHFPHLTGYLLTQPGMCLSFFTTRAHWWLMFSLLSTSTPASFGAELLPDSQQPSCNGAWVVPSQMQDLAFGPVELHKILVSHFFSPSRQLKNGFPSNLQSTGRWKRSLAVCDIATESLKGISKTLARVRGRLKHNLTQARSLTYYICALYRLYKELSFYPKMCTLSSGNISIDLFLSPITAKGSSIASFTITVG